MATAVEGAGAPSTSTSTGPTVDPALLDTSQFDGMTLEQLVSMLPDPPSGNPRLQKEAAPTTTEEEDEAETEKFYQMLLRACKGARLIAAKEQAELFAWMLSSPPDRAHLTQTRAHMTIANKQPLSKGTKMSLLKMMKKEPLNLELSKYHLDFNLTGPCPLNRDVNDQIVITNRGPKLNYTIHMPDTPSTFSIRCDAPTGTLKKAKTQDVNFTLVAKTTVNISEVIVLEIEGGARHFLTVRLSSEKSQFGVEANQLENVVDNGYTVPNVLAIMRKYLVEKGGLKLPNIFRTAASDQDQKEVKDQLNRGVFQQCGDVNVMSSLIKVWFRELPVPVLNTLPQDSFLQCETEAECVAVFEKLQDPAKSLVDWLIDLLADVAAQEPVNQMGARNLSIVVAPNLFQAMNADPLQSLTLSQRVVGLVYHVLMNRLNQRKARGL